MNHHTGKPIHRKEAVFPGLVGTGGMHTLHYCPHAAGNQTVLRTCEQLDLQGDRQGAHGVSQFWGLELHRPQCGVHLTVSRAPGSH